MRTTFKSLFNSNTILDTNILSDLDEINALDLPSKLFSTVFISKNIQIEELDDELSAKVNALGYFPAHLDSNDGYEKFILLKSKYPKLSTSDIVVVCIAFEKGLICCTNDRRARNACDELRVSVAGTIGILACAYENGIITYDEFSNLFNEYTSISLRLDSQVIDPIRKLYGIGEIEEEADEVSSE